MSALHVREANADDAARLAPRLRVEDIRELAAAEGGDPAETLRRGVEEADACWAIVDREGEVIALFGLRADPKRADAGRPWLLASDALTAHGVTFMRESPAWIELMHQRHAVLWNLVDARNHTHVAWLEHCGFRRVKTLPHHGPEQRPFHQFVRVSSRPSALAARTNPVSRRA